MTLLGPALTAAAVTYLLLLYAKASKPHAYPTYGLVGLAVIALAHLLAALGVQAAAVCLLPLVWTGYILAADGAVFSLRGRSLLSTEPEAFVWMAVLSIFLSLVFEGYNLRLPNWTYVGLPANIYLRYLLYGWMFALVWPAILETAEFLLATQFRSPGRPADPDPGGKGGVVSMAAGLLLVVLPVLVPREWGVAAFGLIWAGFVLLVDPLNRRAGRASLGGDLARRQPGRLWAVLLAGALWGLLWEFWNEWAAAKRLYVAPILEQWRIFEVPPHRLVEFSAFGAAVFALYVFAAAALERPAYEIQ